MLKLDPPLIGSVLVEAGHVAHPPAPLTALDVSLMDAGLLDATVRLLRLVETPPMRDVEWLRDVTTPSAGL